MQFQELRSLRRILTALWQFLLLKVYLQIRGFEELVLQGFKSRVLKNELFLQSRQGASFEGFVRFLAIVIVFEVLCCLIGSLFLEHPIKFSLLPDLFLVIERFAFAWVLLWHVATQSRTFVKTCETKFANEHVTALLILGHISVCLFLAFESSLTSCFLRFCDSALFDSLLARLLSFSNSFLGRSFRLFWPKLFCLRSFFWLLYIDLWGTFMLFFFNTFLIVKLTELKDLVLLIIGEVVESVTELIYEWALTQKLRVSEALSALV